MIVVSIVIPVYNSSSTIAETLNSILNQTYKQWEAICVDDGSSDDSVDIIKKYCTKDSRIRILRRNCEEKGGSVCRNIGGRAAKGKYLIFLDSDDLLAPWCIEQRLKVIKDAEYDIAVFPIGYFKSNPLNYTITQNLYSKNHLCRFISGSPTWQTMQPIYRAEVFRQLEGFNIDFPRYQDVEFGIRAIINYHILIVKDTEPDCYFRMSGNSGLITPQKAEKAIKASRLLLILVNSLWNRIPTNNKSTALLGLMVNVAYLEMSLKLPVRLFFDEMLQKIKLDDLLSAREYSFVKYLMDMKSNRINKLFLKVISKLIDIKLDKDY